MAEHQRQQIDIFISSPSDLYPERAALKQMFEDLNADPIYRARYHFHPFLWEAEVKEEDLQGMDWQQYINIFGQNLSQTHLVIGMLWSRLGLELTNFINPITGRPYRSGTEYELFTAFDAERNHGLPRILFYQCNRTAAIPQENDEQIRDATRQLHLAQDFVRELQEDQVISSGVSTFGDAEDLCRQIRADLVRVLPEIEQRLQEGEPVVSTLPALPVDFIPRREDIPPIAEAVHQHHATVLFGLPGQGKTVMARAVCDEVQAQFPDGTLWATIGQRPDYARIQREWILQLHGELSAAKDAASAHDEVVRCLHDKKVLVVLDDVWHASDAQFLIADLPAACHVLMTTRNAQLLPSLPIRELGPMSPADSRELLQRASKGQMTDAQLQGEVAERLGYLALALKIVGARLAHYSWSQIREQLQSERFADLAAGQRNVYLSMDASVRFLAHDQQHRYRELAIFPPDEPLVEAAVARLWQATAGMTADAVHYLLTLFQSLSLIQSTATLHDLQRDYLMATSSDDERHHWHDALIASYGSSDTWATLPDDAYAWRWFAWHLAQAGRTDDVRTLLFDATYLENKISRLQSTSLASDFALLPDDADIALLGSVIALSRHILDEMPHDLPNQVTGRTGQSLAQQLHHWPKWSGPHIRLESQTLKQAQSGLLHILPHESSVQAGIFSSDGKLVLSATANHIVRIWEIATGVARHTIQGQGKGLSVACAFSPDGSMVLSADGTSLRLWDTVTGETLHMLQGHTSAVEACAFSPDGQLALSASGDTTLRLWDVATGTTRYTLQGHASEVTACTFSPDGRYVLSASRDLTLRLWDVTTGEVRHTLQGHKHLVRSCLFSPDGKLVLSASDDSTLRLWDVATGEALSTLERATRYESFTGLFSPDGHWVLSNYALLHLRMWDVTTGKTYRTFQGQAGDWIRAYAFSPDGNRILSVTTSGRVKLWDVATGEERQTFEGHASRVNACAFSPDGQLALTASTDHSLSLWDTRTTAVSPVLRRHDHAVTECAFSPNGDLALSCSLVEGMLRVWNVATNELSQTFLGYNNRLLAYGFSLDAHQVLSVTAEDGMLRVWDVETGAVQSTFLGGIDDLESDVGACAFSADRRFVLSASRDGTLRLWDVWDVATGEERQTFEGHSRFVSACAFSPDGRRILSASEDGTLRLWDVATGETLYTFQGPTRAMHICMFSPDGHLALCAFVDGTLHLWDVATGEIRRTFQGPAQMVTSYLFSPDGRLVLIALEDTTLRLWDVETGQVRNLQESHGDGNSGSYRRRQVRVLFTQDSRLILSIDGMLHLWDVETGKEIVRWQGDNEIVCAALSPDGTHVIAGDQGGVVHLAAFVNTAVGLPIGARAGGGNDGTSSIEHDPAKPVDREKKRRWRWFGR
ncbi:MAG: NB-ARC domain-containing protein [Ktedonobacterales bacterium]